MNVFSETPEYNEFTAFFTHPHKKTWDPVPLNSEKRDKKEWDTSDIFELMRIIWRCPYVFQLGQHVKRDIFSVQVVLLYSSFNEMKLNEMKQWNSVQFSHLHLMLKASQTIELRKVSGFHHSKFLQGDQNLFILQHIYVWFMFSFISLASLLVFITLSGFMGVKAGHVCMD